MMKKITFLEKKLETDNYYLSEIGYKSFFGRYYIRNIITPKDVKLSVFADDGSDVPFNWNKTIKTFLESNQQVFSP